MYYIYVVQANFDLKPLGPVMYTMKVALRPNKIEITVLRPARICFEVAALSILSKFQ